MKIAVFDPGRNVGYALLDGEGRLLQHGIITDADVAERARAADAVVLGGGTGHGALLERLAAEGILAEVVDETGTSMEARRLYFRDHPPGGIARLLPVGMRWPPRPVDDYAAYAIGLRFLAQRQGTNTQAAS